MSKIQAIPSAHLSNILTSLSRSPPSGVPAPDQAVTKLEDTLLKGTASLDVSSISLKEQLPNRPGYGTVGTSVNLWANYIVLEAAPELVLYRYDISVKPAAVGKKLTQIIRLLLEAPALVALKDDVVTDFKSTLISRQKFDDQVITIRYRAEGQDEPLERANQYEIKVCFTNVLAASQLMEYLTSSNMSAQYDEKLPMVQAFNIFLNHYAKQSGNLATIGSSKTFALNPQRSDTMDLGSCLTAVRGFFTSVRLATARVLVNVNVSHGAFYQDGPLDQFILRFGSSRGLYRLEVFLKGLRIRTTHLKDKQNKKGEVIIRVKRIFGLAGKNDGHSLAHPPKVKAFGAGPKDVEFWLDATPQQGSSSSSPAGPKKGGKGAKLTGRPAAAGSGRYISVYDFFANSKSCFWAIFVSPLTRRKRTASTLPTPICLSSTRAIEKIRYTCRPGFALSFLVSLREPNLTQPRRSK